MQGKWKKSRQLIRMDGEMAISLRLFFYSLIGKILASEKAIPSVTNCKTLYCVHTYTKICSRDGYNSALLWATDTNCKAHAWSQQCFRTYSICSIETSCSISPTISWAASTISLPDGRELGSRGCKDMWSVDIRLCQPFTLSFYPIPTPCPRVINTTVLWLHR